MHSNTSGTFINSSEFEPYRPVYTLKNLKKQNMIRLGNLWSAKKLPDYIKCYKESPLSAHIQVPPGVRSFKKFDEQYTDSLVVDHPPLLRSSYDYQSEAISSLLEKSVGLLHASTGSGKTQIIADITHRLKRNTLILVQNLSQMQQMIEDINQILGVIPTQVSGKKYSKKVMDTWYPYITVCSIDSRDKVNPKQYGLILADEVDSYLGSDDRREWMGSLSPEFFYGLTGTIKINHVDDSVFKIYLGKKTELKLHHHTPDYKQVYSTFEYYLDDIKEFHLMKEAMYSAEKRNQLIVDTTIQAINNGNKKGVVFTEYVEHANLIANELQSKGIKTYLLIGEVPSEERERIRQEAKDSKDPIVIVGSVRIIGRGFDLPELSFGVLTVAEKFESSILQFVGRVIRQFPGKPQPIFYDVVDHLSPMLFNQSNTRLRNFKRHFPGGKITIN